MIIQFIGKHQRKTTASRQKPYFFLQVKAKKQDIIQFLDRTQPNKTKDLQTERSSLKSSKSFSVHADLVFQAPTVFYSCQQDPQSEIRDQQAVRLATFKIVDFI